MIFIPGDPEEGTLDTYKIEDSAGIVVIANEFGDIVGTIVRPDGVAVHAYGGPVYDPPAFLNVCEREPDARQWCKHRQDASPAEKDVLTAFAEKVGWMQPTERVANEILSVHDGVRARGEGS
jgi:hypothetical protein